MPYTGNTAMNKVDKNPSCHGALAYILVEGRGRQYTNFTCICTLMCV